MRIIVTAACLLAIGAVSPAFAANANHPYQNCDRRNDNCGPTGDNMTDQLNAQQLGGAGQPGPGAPMMGGGQGAPMMGGGQGAPMMGGGQGGQAPMNRPMPR